MNFCMDCGHALDVAGGHAAGVDPCPGCGSTNFSATDVETATATGAAHGATILSLLNWHSVWLSIARERVAAGFGARKLYASNPSSGEFHAALVASQQQPSRSRPNSCESSARSPSQVAHRRPRRRETSTPVTGSLNFSWKRARWTRPLHALSVVCSTSGTSQCMSPPRTMCSLLIPSERTPRRSWWLTTSMSRTNRSRSPKRSSSQLRSDA
jgi:hypothetical protein